MANVRHSKVSGIPNPADPTLLGGDDWNAAHDVTLVDGDIPASIARDAEVTAAVAVLAATASAADSAVAAAAAADATSKVAAEATLARNADNLSSGTLADARIASTIARDSEVTSAVAAEATARDSAITTAVAALSSVYQPVDSDLTAIAALTTTAYGRAFLALADAAAGRTALGLGTASTAATGDFDAAGAAAAAQSASQPVDGDLTAIAALTTTAFGRGLLALADAAAARTALGLGTAAVAASGDFDAAGSAAAVTTTSIGAVPTARTITAGTGLTGGGDLSANRTLAPDFGSGAGKVTQGNDSRLSDARTPTAHATSHKAGGSDDLSGVQNGFAPLSSGLLVPVSYLGTGTPDGTKFLRDDGVFAVPPGSVTGTKRYLAGSPSGTLNRAYTFASTVESWTATAGTQSSTGGKYRLVHTGPAVGLEPSGASNVADGEFELDFNVVGAISGSASICFRATDASNFYAIIFQPLSPAAMYKFVAGTPTLMSNFPFGDLWRGAALISPIRVLIRTLGTIVDVFFDGTQVWRMADSTHSTGRLGVRADNCTLEIDNVNIYTSPVKTGNVVVA